MADDGIRALATIVRHRDAVRLNVQRLTHELKRRALAHDLSKLAVDEIDGFVEINRTAREHAYGSPEYDASMAKAKEPGGCIALHFARNSHHPEYHEHDFVMGWLDIIEMVLDWKAAADTYGKNTLRGSLPHHRERFAFSEAQWWLIEQVVDWIEPAAPTAAPPEAREERSGTERRVNTGCSCQRRLKAVACVSEDRLANRRTQPNRGRAARRGP